MRIQNNIMAMNAYRNYTNNTSALSKNLEKLSSGYKINRAGDDAAGLAISEKMRAQITGLEGAQKNAKDGISLVQTAEGALTEVHDMLNRMYSLAEQSANGTYENETDRAQLQKEVIALKTEIDRIADSANFNGINLLDGSMAGTTVPGGTDAIVTDQFTVTDGTTPNAATKAEITIKLDGTTATGGGIAITGGTTTITQLGAMQANGVNLSKLFDVEIDGVKKDWTSDGGTTIGSGATIKLVAKTAGNLDSDVIDALEAITDAAELKVEDGTAEGVGANATSSTYDITFNFKNLADGQTFQIGDEIFEISTDGTLNNAGATLIDLKSLDLTDATDQKRAADAIQAAVAGATSFTGTWTVAAAPATITGDSYTLTMESDDTGSATSLGEVRVSQSATGAIAGTHVSGKDQGKGTAGSFASVTYEGFDLSKLAVGDKITIGNVTLEITKDADADVNNKKIGLTDAKNSAELIKAFQANGFNSGKLEINGTKLTITGTTVGEDGDTFQSTTGKLTFTPATAAAGATTTGGLTLQIGDTGEEFNQLTVQINDCHADQMGIGEGSTDTIADIDIGTQAGAKAALKTIENAINYVSDVRGTLGATQNRLDHTINNLSVMQENIQDAESTIRDTDVAEEMMAYTKNNILIQSAQAMLAQANQVPQGVLQLLQ